MITTGVNGLIRPEMRQPQTKDDTIVWQPVIEFFKTDFNNPNPIPVPALNINVSLPFETW